MVATPFRSLLILMAIGIIDLVSTAVLHAQGMITELNPVMRIFIERSEWLFVLAKGTTLVIGFWIMFRHLKHNPQFVQKASLWGSGAYVLIWTTWFMSSR